MTRERAFAAAFLLVVVLTGAWLRFRGLAVPSFWLDEVLGYDLATTAAHQPLWRWLTIFESEHGPLYYATELAGRFVTSPEFSARLFPALFGVATIVAGFFVERRVRLVLPLLLALSPLQVYYSREGRPYALLMLLSTLLLMELPAAALLAVLAAAFYSTAVAIPAVIAAGLAALLKRSNIAAGAAGLCAALMFVVYHPARHVGTARPADVLLNVAQSFSVSAVDTSHWHRTALFFALFAVVGAIDLMRRTAARATGVMAMVALPIAAAVVGAMRLRHFFAVRYVVAALPAYLLLVAAGMVTTAEWMLRRRPSWAPVVAIVLATIVTRAGWEAALHEPFRKLDWRTVARTLTAHAHANDTVIAANDWTAVCLGFYLRALTPPLHLVNAEGNARLGEMFAYQHPAGWLVVGGNDPSPFAEWACRFPVVLASPLENFRLHYFPSPYGFLADRSTPAERRALMASFFWGPGFDGSQSSGGDQAWVAVALGAPRDRTLTLDVETAGRVSIMVNEQARIDVSGRSVRVPQSMWRDGVNRILFLFDKPPARVRSLVLDAAPASEPRHLLRLNEPTTFLDETSLWRQEGGRPLPPDVDPARLTQFVARLGIDPQHAVPALMTGRVTPANLATTIADDSVCLDDASFARAVFQALLGRDISEGEMRGFLLRLQHVSRRKIVRDLANSDEVRALVARR